MADLASARAGGIARWTVPESLWRVIALVLSLALAAAACGTNDEPGGGASAAPPASADPRQVRRAGRHRPPRVSGELTVWAMGNEGTKLSVMADKFMAANPDVNVSVTPVDWGQAVAKLQTAIGGGETPDISQMGTDMMGQFVETGALEPVGDAIDPSVFFESAWQTNVVDGQAYGVPWYVETRVLYYRTDVAEKAGITAAPTTWDELKAMAKAMKEQGGAEWGISLGTKNAQEYLPFVWSNGGDVLGEDGAFALDSPQAVEALEFYDSFFEEGLTPKSVPEGFDITPAFVSGTHPMFFSGPWHVGLITDAGGADIEGKWAVVPMPKKDERHVVRRWGQPRRLQGQREQGRRLGLRPVHGRPGQPGRLVRRGDRAARRPELPGTIRPSRTTRTSRSSAQQLEDTKAPPAIPTWNEVGSAINDNLERVTTGDVAPADGAKAMEDEATAIGTGQ